ncbi:YihY/virulence factor BrkB family protein [Cellulomonas sp.]|uniref:YihY/virulence factor BrkB family protein n=1 Tax=Cellulomonas sp. TaxID=40001 RepID=UPI0025888F21|nr:YihY/virulence factor BrkB family protein [Cellulomonas sp.]MCR6688483.1 YihY/virulence factor BrkB family protein [Cellulomonas sp.]
MTDESSVAKADAPAPDDPRKPESPAHLTRRSWRYVLRSTVREFSEDQCTDLAAALTYYAVLALAPAAIAVLSVFGLVSDPRSMVEDVLGVVDDVGPDSAVDSVRPVLERLTEAPAAGLAFVVGLALALWSASGFVAAFGRGMNRIYEVDEGRPVWKLRPALLLVTLVLVAIAVLVAAMLVLSGPVAQSVGETLGLSSVVVTVWQVLKWPLVLALVVVAVAVLYHWTPNVRQPRFRWISVGAAVAIVVWALASAGFALYVSAFGSYDKTYGSLAGVVVLLLWLWLSNLALLFGAELDAELERGRELQGGIAAEETLQLPPRDTRASDKRRAKHDEAVRRGRELRTQATPPDDERAGSSSGGA